MHVEPGYGRFAVTESAQRSAVRQMIGELRAGGVDVSIFLLIDPLRYSPHPRRVSAGWRNRVAGSNLNSTYELRGCGAPPPLNANASEEWTALNSGVTAAWSDLVEHLEVMAYTSDGFCCDHFATTCACSPSYVHWWEQVAKHAACFERVERHERAVGRRFGWVSKLRPDLPVDNLLNLSAPILMRLDLANSSRWESNRRAVFMLSDTLPPVVFNYNHMGTDKFVLTMRQHARLYFNFSAEVSCDWMARENRHPHLINKTDWRNEELLWWWVESRHVNVRRFSWPWQDLSAYRMTFEEAPITGETRREG